MLVHGIPRLVINFKGNYPTKFYTNGKFGNTDFPEDSWFYCSAGGYLKQNPVDAGEAVSISYYGQYMRVMHISYDGITPPPTERDVFLHTDRGVSAVGQGIIHALDELALTSDYAETAPYLLKALLKISIEDIKRSSNDRVKQNSARWVAINAYIRAHRTEKINRKTVAAHFNLSQGYVSHLFKTFSHLNFSNTLLQLRLEHAAMMLKHSELTVNEICFKSGFNYTSYFIRRFNEYYGMTPYAYWKACRFKGNRGKMRL
ncbi:MAG: AraC family transcriptional regulator [Victivallales bacterium]